MSSVTTTPATAPWDQTAPGGRGLSFLTLLRVEIRKQVDTRAGRGLLIVIGALTLLALATAVWTTRSWGGVSTTSLFALTSTPQGLLLPVLGIITACNEWSQRTALITFTQEPRRFRVVLAKLVSAVVLGTVAVVLAWLLALLAHVVSMSLAGGPVDFSLTPGQFTGVWLTQMLAVVEGVAFGLALLSVPMAIVAYFVLPVLASTAILVVPALQEAGAWLDMNQAAIPLTAGTPLTGQEWAQLGTSALLWIGLPLVIGTWRVLTREVK